MAFDAAFAKYAAVALASLLVHGTRPPRVVCLTADVDTEAAKPVALVAARFGAALDVVPVDARPFADWRVGGHFALPTYFRLVMQEVLPERRVLYIDADLIVTCDLTELCTVEMGGAWVAGVRDEVGARSSRMTPLVSDAYINTGVLVADLDALRGAGFLDRCRAIQAAHGERVTYLDQCLINKAAEGRKHVLDPRWNVLASDHGAWDLSRHMGPYDRRGILHASGRTKPWMTWSDPWIRHLWLSYARLVDLPPEAFDIRPRTVNEGLALAAILDGEQKWQEASRLKSAIIGHLTRANRPPPG